MPDGSPESAWPPPATADNTPTGRWSKWQARPRSIRWTTYAVIGVVGLGAIGAIADDPDTTDQAATTQPAPSATEAAPSTTLVQTAPVAETSATVVETSTTATTSQPQQHRRRPPPRPRRPRRPFLPRRRFPVRCWRWMCSRIPVENEQPDGYDRDLFAYGDTVDAYGCRTRARVLIEESLTPAQIDPVGCAVVAGDWYSPYDGLTWVDPAELEIDHVVALKEAWDSGAWAWTPERLSAFGNDLDDARSMRAVTGSVNQAKSDKDPSNWNPSQRSVRVHVSVGLGVDQGPMGAVDGPIRTRPHPQPAHRSLPRPDDRPMARHAAGRTADRVTADRCCPFTLAANREL